MKLSILIPTYNEIKTLPTILEKISKVKISNVNFEIIIVDDGSTDGTRDLLSRLSGKYKIFFHKKNSGKGAAIITAITNATGDYILIQDADLEYDPEDFHILLAPVLKNNVPIVFGSRFLEGKFQVWSTKRIPRRTYLFGNKLLSLMTKILFNKKISDMETGYKLIRMDIIKSLNLKSRGFDIEPEITCKLLRKKVPIKEVPINYYPRGFEEGKKITWRDGIKAAYLLLKFRFKRI